MNSRYGLWILSICWISLAGCSNWQNRINNGPGTAASLSAAPVATDTQLTQGPGPSFGEPPPPVPPPPSDPRLTLGPLSSSTSQRLDLSAVEPAGSAAPDRMYNLESPKASSTQKSASTSAERSATGSSTISKLASKAKPSASASASSADSKRPGSAVARLSAEASKSGTPKTNTAAAAPARNAEASKSATSAPGVESSAPVDTTFLAQPVRKGASSNSSSDSNSKGPQSNVHPGTSKLLNGSSKPAIYPVSNPVSDEPVDTTQFS